MALSTSLAAQLKAIERQQAEQQRRRIRIIDEQFQQALGDFHRRYSAKDRFGRPVIDVEPIKEDDHGRTSGTTVVGVDTGSDDHGSDPVSDLPSS